MPHIAPFRALAYAPALRDRLDALVAPPYDVQSVEQSARLGSRDPHNVVHLDLPGAPGGAPAYEQAAARLRRWIAEGVLARDERAAYYLYEQTYRAPDGGERTRRGFFARLTLEPFGSGGVIPHEKTLDAPRADRTRLLAATRTHLSAVFLLHPDPGGEVAGRVRERLASIAPVLAARDDEGTVHRVVPATDDGMIDRLTARLAGTWTLIADGHHRYESALAYRDERRAAGQRDSEHVLAFLCSLEDDGLAIFPIHRVVHSVRDFDPDGFRARLEPFFDLARMETPERLRRAVAARSDRAGAFGLVFGDGALWLAEWKEGRGLDGPEMAATPEPLRRLDVVLLHRLVLEGILAITPEDQARQTNLDYVKSDAALFARAAGAQLGILMNATPLRQVIDVARGGFRLPQKSTYFFPKVLTGLVFDPIA